MNNTLLQKRLPFIKNAVKRNKVLFANDTAEAMDGVAVKKVLPIVKTCYRSVDRYYRIQCTFQREQEELEKLSAVTSGRLAEDVLEREEWQ